MLVCAEERMTATAPRLPAKLGESKDLHGCRNLSLYYQPQLTATLRELMHMITHAQ
tara:strand:- start:121 stop:288 length:168 start_codon:yes stop_codon:yes gene_type:complete